MIVKPVLIVGAPRSGTSLLQKIIRDHPAFWSLVSESDIIWNQYCHPKLFDWRSEHLDASDMRPEARKDILRQFERYSGPARVWQLGEKRDFIWSFERSKFLRPIIRTTYQYLFPLIRSGFGRKKEIRLVEKTVSNCLRLGYVNEVFPEAKIIYPLRHGCSNINSLINSWRHPNRFFSYDLPVTLRIKGYEYDRWNFVLPPGWREYIAKPLEEVCAFQWLSCHEAMISETAKPKYRGRVMRVKLEDLSEASEKTLRELADFIEVPWDEYFQNLARELPVVNSPDNDLSTEKWKAQNGQMIERIIPTIEPMMKQLGYSV